MGNSQSYDLVGTENQKSREKSRKSLDETLPSSPCKTVSIHNTSSLRRPKRKRDKTQLNGNEENISVDIENSGRESGIDVSPLSNSPTSLNSSSETERPDSVLKRTDEFETSPISVQPSESAYASKNDIHELSHDDDNRNNSENISINTAHNVSSTSAQPSPAYHQYDYVPDDSNVESIETLNRVDELQNTPFHATQSATATLEITIGPEHTSAVQEYEVIVPVEETTTTTTATSEVSASGESQELITTISVSPPETLYKAEELPSQSLEIIRDVQIPEIVTKEDAVPNLVVTNVQTSSSPSTELNTVTDTIIEIETLYKVPELENSKIVNHPVMETMDDKSRKKKEKKSSPKTKRSKQAEEPKPIHHPPTSELQPEKGDFITQPESENIVFQILERHIPLPTLTPDAIPLQSRYDKLPVH